MAAQQLTFEGLQVLGHKLKLKGKAEAASMEALGHGAEVFVIVRAKITGVGFLDEDDYGAVVREHIAKVEEVVLLPESVSPAIVFETAMNEAAKARDEAKGQQGLGVV